MLDLYPLSPLHCPEGGPIRFISAVLFLSACGSAPTVPAELVVAPDVAPPPAVVVPPAPQAPPDDCTLSLDAVKSILTDKVGTPISAPIMQHRHLLETVRLDTGVELSRDIGGCHHFGAIYTWSPLPSSLEPSDAAWIEEAQSLLAATPLLAEADAAAQVLGRGLNDVGDTEARDGGQTWALGCGDADCTLAVKPVEGGTSLSLSYDFAL